MKKQISPVCFWLVVFGFVGFLVLCLWKDSRSPSRARLAKNFESRTLVLDLRNSTNAPGSPSSNFNRTPTPDELPPASDASGEVQPQSRSFLPQIISYSLEGTWKGTITEKLAKGGVDKTRFTLRITNEGTNAGTFSIDDGQFKLIYQLSLVEKKGRKFTIQIASGALSLEMAGRFTSRNAIAGSWGGSGMGLIPVRVGGQGQFEAKRE